MTESPNIKIFNRAPRPHTRKIRGTRNKLHIGRTYEILVFCGGRESFYPFEIEAVWQGTKDRFVWEDKCFQCVVVGWREVGGNQT